MNLSKSALVRILTNLCLENPNNWCFANATLQAMVWTLVATNQFEATQWGNQCRDLMHFLGSAKDGPANLARAPFFQALMRCWGDPETVQPLGTISQQDAAEFVQMWLCHYQTTAFDMRWEKRYQTAETVHNADIHHAQFTPLCLKFDAISVQCRLAI